MSVSPISSLPPVTPLRPSVTATQFFETLGVSPHPLDYLALPELAAFSAVSRQLNRLANLSSVWASLVKKDFRDIFSIIAAANPSLDTVDWKAVYRNSKGLAERLKTLDTSNFSSANPFYSPMLMYFAERGILENPQKPLSVNLEDFNGIYGLSLDTVGTDDWLKDALKPIPLGPFLEDSSLVLNTFGKHPVTLTLAEGFAFVIGLINSNICGRELPEIREVFLSGAFYGESLIARTAYTALTNIYHPDGSHIPPPPNYAGRVCSARPDNKSWMRLILHALKDKGRIYAYGQRGGEYWVRA